MGAPMNVWADSESGLQSRAADAKYLLGSIMATTSHSLVLSSLDGTHDLECAAGAQVYCGVFGTVRSPASLIVGDRVAARVQPVAGSSYATNRVGSMFIPAQLKVLSIDESKPIADTDLGPLDVSRMHLPSRDAKGLARHDIHPGMALHTLLWVDPRSRVRYVAAATSLQ